MVTTSVRVIGGKISVHYLFLIGSNLSGQNPITRPLPDLDQESGNLGNYRDNHGNYLVKYNSVRPDGHVGGRLGRAGGREKFWFCRSSVCDWKGGRGSGQ